MTVYCTICCKRKRNDPKPVKSIDRYLSGRIRRIYLKSVRDKVRFRIFSGKFGLLKPGHKIPFYDEKLIAGNLPRMVSLLKKQLAEEHISRIVFFSVNPGRDKAWLPYFEALKHSCHEGKVEFKPRFI